MKKYFNNVIAMLLLIAITVSSLSACASKTAASQTAPDKQTSSVTTPQAEIPVPYIDLRDYTRKYNLEKLFEGYTEDYTYAFREARGFDGGGGYTFYELPLRQTMSLNNGDVLILFADDSWKAMQETQFKIDIEILIIVQSKKRYFQGALEADINDRTDKSYFYFSVVKYGEEPECATGYDVLLGRK